MSFATLGEWLNRMGYRSKFARMTVNAGNTESLLRRAKNAVRNAYEHGGEEPVVVIGHSAGGMLALLAAQDAETAHMIRKVITLGSPQGSKETVAHAPYAWAQYLADVLDPKHHFHIRPREIGTGIPVATGRLAVSALFDGVVHREATEADRDHTKQVLATHWGLLYNPFVYEVIANELARPEPKVSRHSQEAVRTRGTHSNVPAAEER